MRAPDGHSDAAPADDAPADAAPADDAPADAAPADAAPADAVPTDDTKADAAPTDDTKTDGDDDANGDAAAKETYDALFTDEAEVDYQVTLPEGMTLDQKTFDIMKPIAAQLKLSQEGFDALTKPYIEEALPALTNSIMEGVNADVAAQQKAWADATTLAIQGGKDSEGKDVTPDPVYGGKTVTEVQAVAAKAIDKIFGQEFREFADETGIGNDPRMVRGMFLAGQAISEDYKFPTGGADTGNIKRTREDKYYG